VIGFGLCAAMAAQMSAEHAMIVLALAAVATLNWFLARKTTSAI
jgi:hypothetical protein